MAFKNLVGEKFGRLTVVGFHGISKHQQRMWDCMCDCGKIVVVCTGHLNSGHTQSCGCLHKEFLVKRFTTHNGTKDRLYKVWFNMLRRCEDTKDKVYHLYGGRGISVCQEWHDYAVFREWANKHGYEPTAEFGKCTLDRIDQNGDYSPNNCRWVSLKIQNNNKRNNHYLEYNGKFLTISQWSEELGIRSGTIERRINHYGWDVKRALETPIRECKNELCV